MTEASKGFVVAGIASGVGKTTVALALIAACRRRGLIVQPFKCGPDFIDGGHHTRASGRASRNLDGWMLTMERNQEIFLRGSETADLSVVEGMMGLFDGVNGRSDAGSTAEIARWLDLPVMLVVDASSIARSVAALVHGFSSFDPALKVAGVIFNRVAGPSHYQLLQDALGSATSVQAFGYLPRRKEIEIPERHLGLVTADENLVPASTLTLLADLAEETIDLNDLLQAAAPASGKTNDVPPPDRRATVCIGVARDPAFSFYYQDNLDALRRAGAEIVEFSPLHDARLPEAVDCLYLGGGYPEVFAQELATNRSMIADVRRAAEEGLPIYAECGGLMYLAREIVTKTGAVPMAAVLPLSVEMTDKLVNFGYTEVSLVSDCLLGVAGSQARGHSFHFSRICDVGNLEIVYRAKSARTRHEEPDGFRVKNVLAGYTHLHFLSNPAMARAFVQYVEDWRSLRMLEAVEDVRSEADTHGVRKP